MQKITVLLILCLLLTACSADVQPPPVMDDTPISTDTPTPPESTTPNEPETPPPDTEPEPPSVFYNDEGINKLYAEMGLEVLNIYTKGDSTFVHYTKMEDKAENMQRYDWFDRTSGRRVLALAEQFTPTATAFSRDTDPNRLLILDDSDFPRLYTIFGTGAYLSHYYAPAEDGYTFGEGYPAVLTELLDEWKQFLFRFGDGSSLSTPLTTTEFIPGNVLYVADRMSVTFHNTVLADDFVEPSYEGVGTLSVESITCDGTDTVIIFRLGHGGSNRHGYYTVYPSILEGTGLAYTVFEFSNSKFSSFPSPDDTDTPFDPPVDDPISPTPKPEYYSDEDIKALYAAQDPVRKVGYEILEIYDNGDDTVVRYVLEGTSPSEILEGTDYFYDWFDRKTGSRVLGMVGYLPPVEHVFVYGENSCEFFVMDSIAFPRIYSMKKSLTDGAEDYRGGILGRPYPSPIETGYTCGRDCPAILTEIWHSETGKSGGISISFGFAGDDVNFDIPVPHMALTTTEYLPGKTEVSPGGMVITFHNTTPADDLVIPEPLTSLMGIEYDGVNTVVTLEMDAEYTRYSVENEFSPDYMTPYAVFEFFTDKTLGITLPEGW